MKKIAQLLIFCFTMLPFLPARAISLGELQIAVQALGFINNPPTGKLTVGIVFAPNIPISIREAYELQTMLGNGLQVGNLFLTPVMIPVSKSDNSDVGLFFLTHGLGEISSFLSASKNKQTLCVTTDIKQVKKGECVLGVKSHPKIEILVNRAAAANCGTKFISVFNMMITEY
jgi:hypothetical protein